MNILDPIYGVTGSILKFFDGLFGNYTLAILAIALIMKIILLPFAIKQQSNSIKQARLQPKEAAIRKKYAGRNDQPSQQKMQQELMEMYQSGGYNPMGGCLPLLIQFPIIILLYNTIMNPLRYMAGLTVDAINNIATTINSIFAGTTGFTEFVAGKFRDISLLQYMGDHMTEINANLVDAGLDAVETLPNLSLFGAENALAMNPTWTSWLVLIPILNVLATVATTILTRKLTFQPMQSAQQQGKIMNIIMLAGMPILTGVIAFEVPAAIGIYWLFNSLLGVIQTVILYFAMPYPKFTEEDYKQAEKEVKGKTTYVPQSQAYKKRSSYLEDVEDAEKAIEDEINIKE